MGVQVSQIHRQLPPGGILVFMTGQREVESLCKRLRTSLGIQKLREDEVMGKIKADKEERGDDIGVEDTFGGDAAEAAEEVDTAGKGMTAFCQSSRRAEALLSASCEIRTSTECETKMRRCQDDTKPMCRNSFLLELLDD